MLAIAERYASRPDARVRWLTDWIKANLLSGQNWNRRRLIIFTDYEDTRRWLERRLQQLNEHAETMKKAEDVIVKAFEALEGFSWDGPAKEYRPNAFLTMD